MMYSRTRGLVAGCTLALGVLWSLAAGVSAGAAAERKALLLLPVASGSPGQEWSAKALAGILEDGFGSLPSVRIVAGTAREVALRELSASATITSETFLDICRRAGADLAVLGGSTLVEGRLALEIRSFEIDAHRELLTFRGEEPLARAFNLVEAAVRHVAATAGIGGAESLFPRGVTISLEAYAAYRAALVEETPAARIEKLRGVLKLDANYADPVQRLGVELFRQGSLEEALGVLERAVALGPKVAEARNNFGVALAAAGRPEQAQREFEEAVSLAPGYAEARLNLARVFEDRNRATDAEKQYTVVLEADAGNDKARAGLAALYDRTGRPDLAIKEFRLLSARRPDLAEAEFVRVGQEARKAREYARAEKFFLRATGINPQFAQGWAELGTNSYLAGEYPKGVEYFRKALAIDPGQAAYHYYLGLALEKGRQQDEALREYRRAVELGGPPEARLGLARAALESGDPGLAVEELNQLLVAAPDHPEAKGLLARATSEMEARRRLVESQSQFANQRLARLEQIVADANRANRDLEARLQVVSRDKQALEEKGQRERGAGAGGAESGPPEAVPSKPPPAVTPGFAPAHEAVREKARAAELGRDVERLQGELAAERDARRGEGAEAQAALALLRADKDRTGKELAEVQERLKRDSERFQAELAAMQAKILELGRGSGEVAELRQRLAGLQADLARAQTGFGQERDGLLQEVSRLKADLVAEREARRLEAERFKAELAASEVARGELAKQVSEGAELKGRLLAAQGGVAKAEEGEKAERERGERAVAAEREVRRQEAERFKAELAASEVARGELAKQVNEAAEFKGQLLAAQGAISRAEDAQRAERERGERALVAEREERRAEVEKLRAELAASQFKKQEKDRLLQELAAERARVRAEQVTLEKAEKTLATERGKAAAALAAREKAEQALSDQRAGSERAIAAERDRGEQAVAAAREESRRLGALLTTRVGVLETQVKTQAELLQVRAAELVAARDRESTNVARYAKSQSDLELLTERQAALEARAVADSRTLAEREGVLARVRLVGRDLALELGRAALRAQSWETARGYLEQAAEADPHSGEAWYGLGEALFQLGQYEKSKQMYDKAKQIY